MKKRIWTHGEHRTLLRLVAYYGGDFVNIAMQFDYKYPSHNRSVGSLITRINLLKSINIKTLDDYNTFFPDAKDEAQCPNLYPVKPEKAEEKPPVDAPVLPQRIWIQGEGKLEEIKPTEHEIRDAIFIVLTLLTIATASFLSGASEHGQNWMQELPL